MESEAAELGGLNGWSGSVLCCFWEVVAVALETGGLRTAAGIFILLLRQQGTKKREKMYKTSSN